MKTHIDLIRLDAAVAKAEGIKHEAFANAVYELHGNDIGGYNRYAYSPSTDWGKGGPIIEREMICLTRAAFPDPEHGHMPWFAESVEGFFTEYGDSALEAAMRCYVTMKKNESLLPLPDLTTPQAAITDEETERALAARLAATEAASRLAEHGFQDIAHTILNALSLLDSTVRRLARTPPKT